MRCARECRKVPSHWKAILRVRPAHRSGGATGRGFEESAQKPFMKLCIRFAGGILGLCGLCLASQLVLTTAQGESVAGWLNWRGPQQNGASLETGLPDTIDPEHPLWVADFPGQSTAVVAGGRLYIMGYLGEGGDLQEGVICYDAETGKELWRRMCGDFLSDTVYLRYGTSAPAVDPETGNVYVQGTQGILAAFTPDGKPLWEHSLMEEYGRLTFPNSRTASPVIDQDLVITRGITANWGAQGQVRTVSTHSTNARASWSGPQRPARSPRIIHFPIRTLAGWKASGSFTRRQATAAWFASTLAPVIPSGGCR